MYSRYGDNGKRSVQLPEHYGGSAFSQQPTNPIPIPKREAPRPSPRDGVGEKASPVADRLLRAETAAEKETVDAANIPLVPDAVSNEAEEKKESPLAYFEKPLPSSGFNFGALRRLFGSKEGEGKDDQDRLLLLGLILLLSRTEGDSDILLWLSLLLLCG